MFAARTSDIYCHQYNRDCGQKAIANMYHDIQFDMQTPEALIIGTRSRNSYHKRN